MNTLSNYDSGREETVFCLAVNFPDMEDIHKVLNEGSHFAVDMLIKNKAKCVSNKLRELANEGKRSEMKEKEIKIKKDKNH